MTFSRTHSVLPFASRTLTRLLPNPRVLSLSYILSLILAITRDTRVPCTQRELQHATAIGYVQLSMYSKFSSIQLNRRKTRGFPVLEIFQIFMFSVENEVAARVYDRWPTSLRSGWSMVRRTQLRTGYVLSSHRPAARVPSSPGSLKECSSSEDATAAAIGQAGK